MSNSAEQIERVPYLTVTSMDSGSAQEWARGMFGVQSFFKCICIGQADPERYRFGARQYRLFLTAQDWNIYKRDGWDKDSK